MRKFICLSVLSICLLGNQISWGQTHPSLCCRPDVNAIACDENGTIVFFNSPSIINPENFWPIEDLVQTQGPPSGSWFPIGQTIVTFRLTYKCGFLFFSTCSRFFSFVVNVEPPPIAYYPDNDGDGYGHYTNAPYRSYQIPSF